MKKIFISLIFISCFVSYSYCYDLTIIRKLFYKAANDENSVCQLEKMLEGAGEESNPTILGYKAMAFMLVSKNAIFPYTKLSYFIKGKYYLEYALDKDPGNVELHYMRFIIQTHVPFFLNYSNNIESDKHIILNNINNITDLELKSYIASSVFKNEKITTDDRSRLADNMAGFNLWDSK